MRDFLCVFIGGGIGALCRFFVKSFVDSFAAVYSSSGTLFVNLVGCFFIGVVFSLFEREIASKTVYLFFATGLLGGFTTYSAFGLEGFLMLKSGSFLMFLSYVVLHLIGGLVFVTLGYKLLA